MPNKDNIWYVVHIKWTVDFKTSCTRVSLSGVFKCFRMRNVGKDVRNSSGLQ